jgi:hypothetical protein
MKNRFVQYYISLGLLTAMICLLFFSGCARIADPQPPEVLIPKAAADLTATQRADSVLLTVTLPDQNTDGSPVTTLKSIEVFCIAEPAKEKPPAFPIPPLTEKEFLARAKQVLSIPSSALSDYLHNKTLILRDTPQSPEPTGSSSPLYRYAVIFVNQKGQAAGLSNQVSIQLISIPSSPEQIAARTTEEAVVLNWTAPSENTNGSKPTLVAGYNVYRSEQIDSFPQSPINPAPLAQTTFQDRSIELNKTYFYAISTVGNLRDPFAESFPSAAIEVKTTDIFPPDPPADFNAILENGKVILLWTPSTSSDVLGYQIRRQEKETLLPQLLQDELVTVLSYQDRKIELNKIYQYSIQAVDAHGNKSTVIRTEVTTR